MMIEKHELGLAIEKARKKKGLNQKNLSQRSGIPQPTISRIEKGKRMPGSDILFSIANALNITTDEIFQNIDRLNKISESQEPYIVIDPLMEKLVDIANKLSKNDLDLLTDFGELLLSREIEIKGEGDDIS